ncbi:MAG: acylphosphatase [Candidatus Brocadiia bacterium]|jgi:acylphosphatase|nr:acylphosphatase [Candidatus Brocadiia bacterium]
MSRAGEQLRAEVVISGRVQGVWLRDHTCEMAESMGLSGYVRNRHDGAVEAAFEGPTPKVRAAVAWCHRGPPMARVESVKVTWAGATGDRSGFRVRF